MRTRWDVQVYNELSDFVVTSAGLGGPDQPFLPRDDAAWTRAIRQGRMLVVSLEQPAPLIVRVVLNEPLTTEEDATWVDRSEATLRLSCDGLVISGDRNHPFGDGYPEFVSRLDEFPAGDYLAEVFTLLPGANGVRTVVKASQERFGTYFRRTRPGQPFPTWLERVCIKTPRQDPGNERQWRGKPMPEDTSEYVSFILRLSPLVTPPARLRLAGGNAPPVPLNPRLPEVCPLGIAPVEIVGRPERPIRGPLRLANRIDVAGMLSDRVATTVAGGPAVVDVTEFAHLYRVASCCFRGTYPEVRVEVPAGTAFAPDWPNASVGVRAEPTPGGWRVAFNAMNWDHVHALPHIAPALGTAPDGVVLELMTADPQTRDATGNPGWFRFRGPIRAGRWHVTEAYPATDRDTLCDAIALAREHTAGPRFALRDASEAEAVRSLAGRDSSLRDAVKEGRLVIEGLVAHVAESDWFARELLAMKIFRGRFGGAFAVYTNDGADESWNRLMEGLEEIRELRTPPRGEQLFAGVRGRFFRTPGKPSDAGEIAGWDASLAELGFRPLGCMQAERVSELTLVGYALPNGLVFALVCLGSLFPRVMLDFFTTFADGSSQTTTTNGLAGGDVPRRGIYKQVFPNATPGELLARHRERMPSLVEAHGEARPVTATLEALAAAVDEYFVRYDAR